MDQDKIKQFADLLEKSSYTVFFGGAGVSTASGVPDFRSATGIYTQHIGAERILTPGFMHAHPEEFYAFNREYFYQEGILPNDCHKVLAALEKIGKLDLVVTQNIDGLHQAAGSEKVVELHGSTLRQYCEKCGQSYSLDEVKAMDLVPHCRVPGCTGLIRPDIVLYEEALKEQDIIAAVEAIARADLLIIGGTSLTVYPAAGLIQYQKATGKKLLINMTATPSDRIADLIIRDPIAQVFAQTAKALNLAY